MTLDSLDDPVARGSLDSRRQSVARGLAVLQAATQTSRRRARFCVGSTCAWSAGKWWR